MEEPQKKIKFRNYNPYDKKLKQDEEKVAKEEEKGEIAAQTVPQTATSIIKQELESLKSEELNIVPKKPNHDLKNMVQARLDKLKRRTQKAIVEILREKIMNEDGEDDDSSDDE